MNAVIYARYSCENQREESIEGQIRECTAFAERVGITIVGTYIDRAKSARTTEKRLNFQKMIKDSEKGCFDCVLVWKFDRFARDRLDSVLFKHILKNHGVKVKSVTEHISEGSEGIILESVLEGMAEYYSVELAEKISRGMTDNVINGKFNGGVVTYGYYIDSDKRFQIEPSEADVVIRIFKEYDFGMTMKHIALKLNSEGVRQKNGSKFSAQTIGKILHNRRYIGEYKFRDEINLNAIPPIIPKDLFDSVQKRMKTNHDASAKYKAPDEYILTTKIFCGKCGRVMVGESGTSANQKIYRYYKCAGAKRFKDCDKKPVKKEFIEDIVIAQISKRLMDDKFISELIDAVMESLAQENTVIPMMKNQYAGVEKSINNLLNAIEQGIITLSTKQRLQDLENQKSELYAQICKEELAKPTLTRGDIQEWFNYLRSLNFNKKEHRIKLVDCFLNAVFVYDDKLVFSFNYKEDLKTVTFDEVSNLDFCSDLSSNLSP